MEVSIQKVISNYHKEKVLSNYEEEEARLPEDHSILKIEIKAIAHGSLIDHHLLLVELLCRMKEKEDFKSECSMEDS